MSVPPKANLEAYQGDTWSQTFRFLDEGTPVDLTSATVEAWARDTTGGIYELAVTVGPAAGEVTIAFVDETVPRDIYDYDVEVTIDGAVRTWVRGRLQVLRDVTNEVGVTP